MLVGNNPLDLLVEADERLVLSLLALLAIRGDALGPEVLVEAGQQPHGVPHPVRAEGCHSLAVSLSEEVVEKTISPEPVSQDVPALGTEARHEVRKPRVEVSELDLVQCPAQTLSHQHQALLQALQD